MGYEYSYAEFKQHAFDTCHFRESGDPEKINSDMDSRVRGNDKLLIHFT